MDALVITQTTRQKRPWKPVLFLILANIPLLAFTWYLHYSLTGLNIDSSIWDHFAIWILLIFKIGGANIILVQILFDPINAKAFQS